MALNTYLTLQLDGVAVVGSVTQKGREGKIEVNSFEWSFDSDGNIGEVKFLASVDKATVPISAGLKSAAVADALFQFWTPQTAGGGGIGTEVQYYSIHGTNGKVTSVDIWMLNNNDPNLLRYDNSVQYTMSFPSITETWMADGTTTTIS
jgi:type VI protein secretion system component Hcp